MLFDENFTLILLKNAAKMRYLWKNDYFCDTCVFLRK